VYSMVSQLVYSATGADVRDVIIDGRLVMENRRLLTLDEEEILEKMQRIKGRITQRIAP
jgi:5-methylthioadenosine/S-adenosylhomocysteine deaminase